MCEHPNKTSKSRAQLVGGFTCSGPVGQCDMGRKDQVCGYGTIQAKRYLVVSCTCKPTNNGVLQTLPSCPLDHCELGITAPCLGSNAKRVTSSPRFCGQEYR